MMARPTHCLTSPPVLATNQGPAPRASRRASTLKAGLAEASGELLAFSDADDLWADEKLAQQSAALASDLSIEAVFGQVVQCSDMDCRIAEPNEIRQKSKPFVGVSKTSMLIRR